MKGAVGFNVADEEACKVGQLGTVILLPPSEKISILRRYVDLAVGEGAVRGEEQVVPRA